MRVIGSPKKTIWQKVWKGEEKLNADDIGQHENDHEGGHQNGKCFFLSSLWLQVHWLGVGKCLFDLLQLGPVEARHFLAVSGQQVTIGKGWSVPATRITEKLSRINLDELLGVGLDHAENPGVSENDQFVFRQQDPTVAVFAPPPFQLAVRGIQASERVLIEAIDEAVLQDGVGKLALEIL